MLKHYLNVTGPNYSLSILVGALAVAEDLVKELFILRKEKHKEPYGFFDEDNHLIGFVIPIEVTSVLILPELVPDPIQQELTALQLKLLRKELHEG